MAGFLVAIGVWLIGAGVSTATGATLDTFTDAPNLFHAQPLMLLTPG